MPRRKLSAQVQQRHIAIYLRVSTEEQATSGLGMEAQKVRCDAMVLVDGHTEPIQYYTDDGVSGTKDPHKRPGSSVMLQDIKAGKVKALYVAALDRVARSVMFTLQVVEEMKQYNVTFVCCKEKLDTATYHGMFALQMFAALAEMERNMTSERTKDALTEKGKRDGEKGGRVPYGYSRTFAVNEQKENKTTGVEIDQKQAVVVRYIFDLRMNKRFSMKAIADALNKKYPISPRGGEWYASGVREILLNEQDYRGGSRGESAVVWPTILRTEEARA